MNTPLDLIPERWRPWVIGGLALAAVLALLAAAAWLAGAFVLLLQWRDPTQATLLTWYQYWYWYAEALGWKVDAAGIAGLAVAFGVPVALWVAATREVRALHGDARWANDSEIREAGLTGKGGLIIGRRKGRYLMYGGAEFVLLAAPTRSGKGAGIVVPNTLNWADSEVVLDIKGEAYRITAGFRARHGQEVHLFAPFTENGRTSRWNPFAYVRDGYFRIGDIQDIGECFYPTGGDSRNKFFEDTARDLFIGLALYLFETPDLPCTMGEVLRQGSGKGQSLVKHLSEIVERRQASDRPLSSECADMLLSFVNAPDNTRGNIAKSFEAPLGLWRNPILDAATSGNDFDFRDLRRRRITIYFSIAFGDLAKAQRLLNLFFTQILTQNTKQLPEENPELKYQCLLLLDEFTALGRVGVLEKGVGLVAGYGLRLLTSIQTQAQLDGVYGSDNRKVFLQNHALKIIYTPGDADQALDYSRLLGTYTAKATSTSRQTGPGRKGESESVSDQARPLMNPTEMGLLSKRKQIVTLAGARPILCDKIRYFAEKAFQSRLLPAPEVPALDMDHHLAVTEQRIRPATLKNGGDLGKIKAEFSGISIPSANSTEDEKRAYIQGLLGRFAAAEPEAAGEKGPSGATAGNGAVTAKADKGEAAGKKAAASDDTRPPVPVAAHPEPHQETV